MADTLFLHDGTLEAAKHRLYASVEELRAGIPSPEVEFASLSGVGAEVRELLHCIEMAQSALAVATLRVGTSLGNIVEVTDGFVAGVAAAIRFDSGGSTGWAHSAPTGARDVNRAAP